MPSLLLSVLPLAIGAAVSPTALVVELLVLSSKQRPRAKAWAYAIGFAAVMLAAVTLFLTVSHQAAQVKGPSDTDRIVDGVAALLLALVGVRSLLPRATPGEKHTSKVAARIAQAGPGFYLGVGAFTMLINFSTLILLAPACHEITRSTAALDVKVAATVMLVLIALLPVLLPVLAVTLLGARADAVLARVNVLVTQHSRQINAAVCLVLAALLAWKAVR